MTKNAIQSAEDTVWQALTLLEEARLRLDLATLDPRRSNRMGSAIEQRHARHAADDLTSAVSYVQQALADLKLLVADHQGRALVGGGSRKRQGG